MGRIERKQQAAADKKTPKKRKKRQSFKSWFKGLKTWKKVLLIGGATLIVLF